MSAPAPASGYDALRELALDLRWSWHHGTDAVWRALDAELWDATQNPLVVLHTASRARIERLLAEPGWRDTVDAALEEKRRHAQSPAWFQDTHPAAALRNVAYFSMEFMLAEALPIYSGGLGNVAGDQLKAASDLGVPVTGVGLLYAQGYFRQRVRQDGSQEALYPANDPGQLPIRPLRTVDGEWLRLRFDFPGATLWVRTWEVQLGRRRLYLLDTNDPANLPAHRCITSELYGGGPELRLQQELVLGIGGWRLLRAIGLAPEVCHLNEGHAAFAALERAGQFCDDASCSFDEALIATRPGNIFTTHTAVAAGFDRFDAELLRRYLTRYAETRLGISIDDLLALGRQRPGDRSEPFNMAYLAIRTSGAVSAVSALHEQVSKAIFAPLFPRWPTADIPVGHVTNGIHVPSWDGAEADLLWTEAAGKERWRGDLLGVEQAVRSVSAADLWDMRSKARPTLITYLRREHARQLAEAGAAPADIAAANSLFAPDALTLGFARRFAPYKRPHLLLHDPERLARLLLDRDRPVQLVVAGKAHPADKAGQALVQQWTAFARRAELRARVVFLADYDMLMAQHLVRGVDVWINTPQRPWEASGTSGMKLLANGGLNLSERDGWWAEAYRPEVGWAIGDGAEHEGDPAVDAAEAEMLYTLLEREIVPEFYDRGADGIPARWVARIRESIASLAPRFSANRAVREYTEKLYLPAATDYLARAADHGARARDLFGWLQHAAAAWAGLRFGALSISAEGAGARVTVELQCDGMSPDALAVELYADPGTPGAPPIRVAMEMRMRPGEPATDGSLLYVATLASALSAERCTPRIMLRHPELRLPLEMPLILWQR